MTATAVDEFRVLPHLKLLSCQITEGVFGGDTLSINTKETESGEMESCELQ